MKAYLKGLSIFGIVSFTFEAAAQITGQDTVTGLLHNVYFLYGLMIFGSILSAVKQLTTAKMDGSTATVSSYLSHIQEILITLGGNTIAFFALVDSGNLNFVSAVGIGYAINSLADLNPAGSRSTTLKQ